MERLKIIKELNNVANILEDNGRISEASQITNVLIKIAQVAPPGTGTTAQNSTQPVQGQPTQTQPTPGQPAQQNQTQLTPQEIAANKEQAKQNNKKRFLELIQLRDVAEAYRNALSLPVSPTYSIDQNGFKIETSSGDVIGKTIQELVENLNKKAKITLTVPSLSTDKDKYAEKVAQDILSAADWPDPDGDASITKAINENYMLGYNLLAGTYYIGNKSNSTDNIDKKDINQLKPIFEQLGKYYKANNNKFPDQIYKANKEQPFIEDPNQIIMNAFKEKVGEKWKFITSYKNHPNYEDIRRGFVQEHNRREPNTAKHISLTNPITLNNA
jgi:hypothetical protein